MSIAFFPIGAGQCMQIQSSSDCRKPRRLVVSQEVNDLIRSPAALRVLDVVQDDVLEP